MPYTIDACLESIVAYGFEIDITVSAYQQDGSWVPESSPSRGNS
jgi:hypothetical protein